MYVNLSSPVVDTVGSSHDKVRVRLDGERAMMKTSERTI